MVQRINATFGVGQSGRVTSPSMVARVRRVAPVVSEIITRTTPASIGAYTAGERPIDRYTPGLYASTAGSVVVTPIWRVNGTVVAGTTTLVGTQTVELDESVSDTAGTPPRVWTYGPVTVPAVAPTITVALAQTAYAAGQVLDASDIIVTMTSAGSPPVAPESVPKSLRVNGLPVSLPHTAALGQSLVGRGAGTHPGGAFSADSPSEIVLPAVQLVHNAGTGWVITAVADDEMGGITFSGTIGDTPVGPFTRTAAQQISGAAVNHIAPVIAESTPAGTYAASVGLWTHGITPEPAATYQWRRDGTAISGATSATYATGGADAGTTLTCAVTVAGVPAVSNGIAIGGGAGLTVAAATDGITVSGTTSAATGATDGITIAE